MAYLPEFHNQDETCAEVAQVALPTRTAWVIESGDRVVGVATLDGNILKHHYVLPGEQGSGVGSRVLAKEGVELRRPAPVGLRPERAPRAFSEHPGYTAVEIGDGPGNEEAEPDVPYQWLPTPVAVPTIPISCRSSRIPERTRTARHSRNDPGWSSH